MRKLLLLDPEDFAYAFLSDDGDLNVPLDEQTTLLLTREAVSALLDKITQLEEERLTPKEVAADESSEEISPTRPAPGAAARPEQPTSGSTREGKQISIFEALNRARGETMPIFATQP